MAAPTPQLVPMTNVLALPAGTMLAGDHRIDRVLGAGGFGITYLARDLVLDRAVTIKEYFPVDFAARGGSNDAVPRSHDSAADYQWGLDRFIEEAKTLAQFDHRNIVKVFRYFQENATAYMVLQFEEGRSLKAWQKALGRAPRQTELDAIVGPLLDALATIHAADFLHRDIAPDNIIIRLDGSPVLIDFGSARGDIARHSRTVSALVKPGYSPYEQYSETGSQQGAWTDIYALGATLYHVCTGKRPPDSPSRIVKDTYVSAHDAALGAYRPRFLDAIDHALALDMDRRPRSVAQWRGELLAPDDRPKAGFFRRRETPPVAMNDDSRTVLIPPPPLPPHSASQRAPALPPQPDAPGSQGGFLDFLDALRSKLPSVRNKPVRPASLAEALEGATPQPASLPDPKPSAAESLPKRPSMPPPVPGTGSSADNASSAARARRRPRAMRGTARRWRPLVVKLLIGVAIASLAVTYQNQRPSPSPEQTSKPSPSPRVAAVDQSPVQRPAKPVKRAAAAAVPTPAVPAPVLPAPVMAHEGGARSVVFSAGDQIVSSGLDGTIKVWQAGSGRLISSLPVDNGPPTSMAVRGDRVLTGHGNGTVSLWSTAAASRLASFRDNEAAVWAVAFADSPTRFLAAGHDWKIRLWDVAAKVPVAGFDDHRNAVQAIGYSESAALFVSAGADKTVKLWDLANLDLVRTYRGHKDFVTAVAISPDGSRLASADLRGQIRMWTTRSSKLAASFGRHNDRVAGLAFSPDGTRLASASADGTIRLWYLVSRRAIRAFAAGSPVNAVAFSPDGTRLISAGADGMLRFWPAIPDDAGSGE